MPRVLIAGGGIGGLVTALTMHQIGVRCTVFEAVPEIQPRGVGLSLQPNAVRELYDLGIGGATLNSVGLPLREWALIGMNGKDILTEARGVKAGYHWPQFSVDRGLFHMLLYQTVLRRLGPLAVVQGARAKGYRQSGRQVTLLLEDGREEDGSLLIGADGFHSAIRAQMYPDEPPINWGGVVMWRGVTRAKPIRTGSSYVGLGRRNQRLVVYPISHPGTDGLARINWTGGVLVEDHPARLSKNWFRRVEAETFAPYFADWDLGWLDVPALIRGAEATYENLIIDRDPLPSWRDGRVVLLGDAAHPMFPTGANGASQTIIDARVLGASLIEHGLTVRALHSYDDKLCAPVSAMILRNRGDGPFELLRIVDERCGGVFDSIDDVIPLPEREALLARYKIAASFARDMLNSAPPLIAPGAQVAVKAASRQKPQRAAQ